MKTPDEIKESLRRGASVCHDIKNCEYKIIISEAVAMDAVTYIEQLEERIALMMTQMSWDCGCCAHKGLPSYKSPCAECLRGENRPMWQYEGLPELTKEFIHENCPRISTQNIHDADG